MRPQRCAEFSASAWEGVQGNGWKFSILEETVQTPRRALALSAATGAGETIRPRSSFPCIYEFGITCGFHGILVRQAPRIDRKMIVPSLSRTSPALLMAAATLTAAPGTATCRMRQIPSRGGPGGFRCFVDSCTFPHPEGLLSPCWSWSLSRCTLRYGGSSPKPAVLPHCRLLIELSICND